MKATNATFMMTMMMMVLTSMPSPLLASESPTQSPSSSSFKCTPCRNGMEANTKCVCKNPIKATMYFPHASMKEVNNSTRNLLTEGLLEYLNSSNGHVESVTIRNATNDVSFHYLKVEISVFPVGRENFTQGEFDVVSFALSTETYKAPAMFGMCYFKQDMYIYLHGEGEGGSDSPDTDAIIIKVVSSVFGVLMMFLTAAVLYFLRKKMIGVREPKEHNVEKTLNWVEMLDGIGDML